MTMLRGAVTAVGALTLLTGCMADSSGGNCESYAETVVRADSFEGLKEAVVEKVDAASLRVIRRQGKTYVNALTNRGRLDQHLEVDPPVTNGGRWSAFIWHQCID